MKNKPFRSVFALVVAVVLFLGLHMPRASAITPDEFTQLGFGYFPHFGINTYLGKTGPDGMPHPNTDKDAFLPTNFDADQWVKAAYDAGMDYVTVVAKHRYGWAAWQTNLTDYGIANMTNYSNLDIVQAVADACRRYGLKLAIYFNSDDKYKYPNGVTGNSGYTAFAKQELDELLTRYGEVIAVWFDHAKVLTNAQVQEFTDFVHEKQPGALALFHDDDKESEVKLHELIQGPPPVGNDNPWEVAWKVYDEYWAFTDNDGPASDWDTAAEVAGKLHYYNMRYSALSLSVPPGPNGLISPAGVALMQQVGQLPRWRQTDDRDAAIVYGGTWTANTNSSFYKSTGKNSNETDAYAEYAFTGSGIRLVTKKTPNGGIFDIYLDGAKVATYDSYAAQQKFDVTAYETTSLADGPHTIKMVVTGAKNPNAANNYVNLDLFEYAKQRPPITPIDTSVDDTNAGIVYTGAWSHISRSSSYEGTISYSNTLNAQAEYTFTGTGVKLYTQKGPGGGKFDIFVDGVLQTTYDSYAASQKNQQLAFDLQNMASGTHTIKIVVTHTKNANANNYNVHLDYLTYN
ncbi:alpha-L-fucosidase [Paenibacillus cymbidii]|uniref:alpha-L-fucosidase n=1 Tax=Paenibacillus cymbidii TaxID=1639034 RepID=UPI00107FF9FA|nr:alpha-L-fucosidase [Paenibacillus cymbidii]